MRIAVSAETNAGLEAPVAGHFGRCPFFALIDLEGELVQSVQVVANPFFPHHEPGQVPGFVHSQGAHAILTGGMGGRAAAFFEDYGIRPITGAAGTVQQALESLQRGDLGGWTPCSEHGEHGEHSERCESVAHGHGHDHHEDQQKA